MIDRLAEHRARSCLLQKCRGAEAANLLLPGHSRSTAARLSAGPRIAYPLRLPASPGLSAASLLLYDRLCLRRHSASWLVPRAAAASLLPYWVDLHRVHLLRFPSGHSSRLDPNPLGPSHGTSSRQLRCLHETQTCVPVPLARGHRCGAPCTAPDQDLPRLYCCPFGSCGLIVRVPSAGW